MNIQYFAARTEQGALGNFLGWPGRLAQFFTRFMAGQLQDAFFSIGVRVINEHMHQETVQLGFRQRVGAFLLERVLRGHDQDQVG